MEWKGVLSILIWIYISRLSSENENEFFLARIKG